MKKAERNSLSILIQSLPVLILVLIILDQIDNDFFVGTLGALFLIQCFDAVDRFPFFKAIVKYFLIALVLLIIGVAILNLFVITTDYHLLLGFIYGLLWITGIVLIVPIMVFAPTYYLGTLFYKVYLLQLKVKDRFFVESNILDDHFLNNAA